MFISRRYLYNDRIMKQTGGTKANTGSSDLMHSDQFSLNRDGTTNEAGYVVSRVHVTDSYHHRKYKLERKLFLTFTSVLQGYLAKRPHIGFTHRGNLARPLVYLPAGVRAWTAYMPGGLATHPVHNPETKTLASGKKIDLMTRRLFRHSIDAIGLRTRAYIMTWRLGEYLETLDKPATWLSLASGSGQPVYDAVDILGPEHFRSIVITDGDEATLKFANKIAREEGVGTRANLYSHQLDVFDKKAFNEVFETHKPLIVDAMGLFEYLEPEQAAELLRRVYEKLPPGGVFIYTNMSPEHPHLDLHQRGLGWPGVIPRTVSDMAAILKSAGIATNSVQIFRAQDKVYNVYQITKPGDT